MGASIYWKYFGGTLEPWRHLAYGRSCSRYGKIDHFEQVCRKQKRQVPNDDMRLRAAHHTCQDDEGKEVAAQEFHVVRLKVFNFHNVRSVIIMKVKIATKSRYMWIQKKGIDSQIMPSTMYKEIFLQTNIKGLNKQNNAK